MTQLLINTSGDYADEFDYPVISFFSSALKNYLLLKGFHYLGDSDFAEVYFGSNEALSFTKNEVISLISNAEIIEEDYLNCARGYLQGVPCVDIIDYLCDAIADSMSDEDEDELKNFKTILDNEM